MAATKRPRVPAQIDVFHPHITTEPNSGCWLWVGDCVRGKGRFRGDGYGTIRRRRGEAGQLIHRLSWEQHVGPIPEGMYVLHRCDVRSCCNPAHLFLGTLAENNADMRAKGRQSRGPSHGAANRPPRGEDHYGVKLTDAQVAAIRADPRSSRKVAPEYGVGDGYIRRLRRNANRN